MSNTTTEVHDAIVAADKAFETAFNQGDAAGVAAV